MNSPLRLKPLFTREKITVVLTLTLLPLVYFLPAVRGRVLLAIADSWTYSLPMRMLLGRMIASGTLPLWNPYTYAGMPLLAAVQPGVLYPPNWLFAVLPPGVAMNAVTILTYHVALVGTYLYARALTLNRTGALVAAMAFTFGGFMIGHQEMTNYVAAAAWLPWILLAIEKLYRSGSWKESWRWAALGALFIALQCYAGLPQATWQTMLVCGPYFLFSLACRDEEPRSWRFALRFTASISVMALSGALLSAVQLLPTVELQQQGDRAAIPYEAFAAFPMAPSFLLTLVFPYFFGGGLPPLYHVKGWGEWWLTKYGFGYVGILGLVLILTAWLAPGRRRIVWFWTFIAAAALVLSLGDYLPFGLYHLLYRVPVFNLFRASYRHTFEFTFAAAVLAGIGAHGLAGLRWEQARRVLRRSSLVLAVIVATTTILFRFYAHHLGAPTLPPAADTALARPEAVVPLLVSALSIVVVWLYAKRRTRIAGALLILGLLIDLASFGWFAYWRRTSYETVRHLADAAAVKVIKAREADLNSFRVISQASWPFGENYPAVSSGNLAMARGLESAGGYDPMRLPRLARLAGAMNMFGIASDHEAFGLEDQGLNLLNVRYLLRERSSLADEKLNRTAAPEAISYEGILMEMMLGPGRRLELEADGFAATELTVISAMFNGAHVPDGAPVLGIRLHTKDGRVVERELRAGRDTAEWAYERPDLRGLAKHERAPVIQTWTAASERGSFTVHRYLARFNFERAEIDYVELDYRRPDAELNILRASLRDSATGDEAPLDRLRLPPERWRLVERCGQADLYENLKALPRAWFASRTVTLPEDEVLRSIKEGKLSDGQPFDPAEAALLERAEPPPVLPAIGRAADAEVKITRYEPLRIELRTRNAQPGFLVLSETDYRGWEARVDGQQTRVHRTNYTLRGVVVPAGEHRVEFAYRPQSFRAGLVCAGIGLLVLATTGVITARYSGGGREANL